MMNCVCLDQDGGRPSTQMGGYSRKGSGSSLGMMEEQIRTSSTHVSYGWIEFIDRGGSSLGGTDLKITSLFSP